jgi:hypothetical protein
MSADFKPVKEEVKGIVILPLLVFPVPTFAVASTPSFRGNKFSVRRHIRPKLELAKVNSVLVENKDNEFVGLEKTWNLTFRVTRLSNFSSTGLLLEAHYDFLKG